MKMDFDKRYPKLTRFEVLFNFLGAGFEEVGPEFGATDEDAAKRYSLECEPAIRVRLLKDGKTFLEGSDFSWDEVGNAANRYFTTEEDTRRWLSRMLGIVEATKPHKGKWLVLSIPRNLKKKIKEQYPRLSDFFSKEFLKSRFQEHSDKEIVRRFKLRSSSKLIAGILEEGKNLLKQGDFPWEEINVATKQYFTEIEDFNEWLNNIIQEFESMDSGNEIS